MKWQQHDREGPIDLPPCRRRAGVMLDDGDHNDWAG